MNLLSMLMGTLGSDNSVDALAKKTGLSSANLSKLLMAAVPLLLKFMTKNASSAGGAQSLLGALGGPKETRSMADQIADADEEDGSKIVRHILGDESDAVVNSLAKDTDLGTADVQKALANIAPAMMSGLSAATSSAAKVDLSDGLDLGDLMGMFGGASQASSASGLLGGLLGGGNALGGILGGGKSAGSGLGSLLGGLFGGKEEEQEDDGSALLGMLTSLMK